MSQAKQTVFALQAEYGSAFANCLQPLLRALNWPGSTRHLAESLPHPPEPIDLTSFRKIMDNIRYLCHPVSVQLKHIDERLLPCLFVTMSGEPYVILKATQEGLEVVEGSTGEQQILSNVNHEGKAYIFRSREEFEIEKTRRKNWLISLVLDYKPMIMQALLISFFLNIFALATPLFIMVVYDKVISTESISLLVQLAQGLLIVLIGVLFLQTLRSCLLSHVGARLDRVVSTAIFERILYLPSTYTESATIGSQLSRLKDFDSVREFFSGPLSTLILELPFAFIYIIVITLIGGIIALIPLIMLVVLCLVLLSLQAWIRRNLEHANQTNTKRQSFLLEAVKALRVVKYCGAEITWHKRYRSLAADAAVDNLSTTLANSVTNTFADMFMIITGALILTVGVYQSMENNLSIGALVAVMMLSWRVLGPLKSIFSALPQFDMLMTSMRQVNALMNIKPESDPEKLHYALGDLKGAITCKRVGFRYKADPNPVIMGVNFSIAPGEVVAVMGQDGSGKSTLFKLFLDLYQPATGAIFIDNRDIRQLDHIELRHAIAYAPEKCHVFTGTVRDNLLLACPDATEADIIKATTLVGLNEEVEALPQGFFTQIGNNSEVVLPESFLKQLVLARAVLKQSKILLMDEPTQDLSVDGECALLSVIDELRGQTTIVMITHDKQLLRTADRILFFEQGQLMLNGSPEQVINRLPAELL